MGKELKVGALVFRVANIEQSAKFYGSTLGLAVQMMDPDPGHADEDGGRPWMMAQCGPTTLVFFEGTEKAGRSPVVVFELESGGIDEAVESLARQGVNMLTPVSHAPGGWSADFTDADGHMLSYYQSAKLPR